MANFHRRSNFPHAQAALYHEENNEKQEIFDRIYVAYYRSAWGKNYLPRPAIDNVTVLPDWTAYISPFTLHLNDSTLNADLHSADIDPTRKYTFKWISETIPNPRAIFYIYGRKFICEKITATFTEQGMSQLLKGDFYLVV